MYDIYLQTETLLDSNPVADGMYTTYRGTKGCIEPEYEVSAEKGIQGWKVKFQCLNYDDLPVFIGVPYEYARWQLSAIEVAKTILVIGQQVAGVD